MSFRTVVITKESKLSLRMNHLVVKNEKVQQIPLGEILTLVIENPNITMTAHLLNALTEHKIITIVCGKERLPQTIVHSIYGHHRQSRLIEEQFNWDEKLKDELWKKIICLKILHQKKVINKYFKKLDTSNFDRYIDETLSGDSTNREGHAAKVYFNIIFGEELTRETDHSFNAALNYGYQILLSVLTRTIVCKGYLSEIGISHHNEYNLYNLSSDLMELLRPLIDDIVLAEIGTHFDKEAKRKILDIFNKKIIVNKKAYYLVHGVEIYVDSVFKFLKTGDEKVLKFPKLLL